MAYRELAQRLVTNLGNVLALPELKLDEGTSSCVLLFDEDIVLHIEFDEAGSQMILSAHLGGLPPDSAEPLLRDLMVANLYWHRTDGATLGMDNATNAIVLAQAHSVTELDDAAFEKWVETFVNQAERWKKHIAGSEPAASDPATESPYARPPDGAHIFG